MTWSTTHIGIILTNIVIVIGFTSGNVSERGNCF